MVRKVTYNAEFRRQLFVGLTASFGAFCSASVYGWLTPILPQLLGPDSEIPMTPQEASWMIAGPTIANIITPIPTGLLANKVGRKPVMFFSAPFFAIGWIIILYFKSFASLIVARCIQEAVLGVMFTIIPVYLGEIASKESRGAITSLFFVSYRIGLLFEYCTGPFLSFTYFTILTLITSLIFFIASWYLPETPHYLLLKGKTKEALSSLSWLRTSTEEPVKEEFEIMLNTAEKKSLSGTTWKDVIATPTDRKALYILLFVGSVRVFSGTMPITAYATEIFNVTNNLILESKYITMLLGLVFLLGTFVSSFTLDVVGRRPLLIWSSLGTSLCMFIVGSIYFLESETEVDVSNWSWLAPLFTLVYALVVDIGLFPVSTAYTSELFTSNTRSTASGISSVLSVFLITIELKLYQDFIDLFGLYFNFFVFGCLCFFGAVVSFLYMPETKNKTFDQIRDELIK